MLCERAWNETQGHMPRNNKYNISLYICLQYVFGRRNVFGKYPMPIHP